MTSISFSSCEGEDPGSSPFFLALESERGRLIARCMAAARLTPKQEELIIRRYWLDMTLQEIATLWGVSRVAVHAAERRALRRLLGILVRRRVTRIEDVV